MLLRLRQLLTSVPSITVVGLLSAYLLLGFLALPAVLKWQLEKQFADRGHALRVAEVRFDPLRLTLEIDQLALADTAGKPMLGFDNLMVDLEWRSITDRTWTIADSRLLAPMLRIDRAKDGSHNFSALLAQFASDAPEQTTQGTAVPPVRVERMLLTDGRIEWLDQQLEQPLVSRIAPLHLQLSGLSTTGTERGRYRLEARTEAGESLELHGAIGIEERHASGELALRNLQVATLARGLHRRIALQSPRGSIDASGGFDVTLGANGVLAGGARDLQLVLADLFLQPPGSSAPLFAVQDLALRAGRLDLARRELHFDVFQVADASANAGIDAQGRRSWSAVVPQAQTRDAVAAAAQGASTAAQAPPPASAPASATRPASAASAAAATMAPAVSASASTPDPVAAASAAGTGRAAAGSSVFADAPWAVSIGDMRIDRLTLALRDASQQRAVTVTELGLATALDARVGGAELVRLTWPQLRLTVNGLALEQADASVTVPSTQLETGTMAVQARGERFEATLGSVRLTLAHGASARRGGQSASVGASAFATSGIRSRASGDGTRLELDAPQWQAQSLEARSDGQSARIGQLDIGGSSLVFDAGTGANGTGTIALALEGPKLQFDTIAVAAAGNTTARTGTGIGTDTGTGTGSETGTGSGRALAGTGSAKAPAAAARSPQTGQSARLARLNLQAQRLSVDLAGGDNSMSLATLQSQLQDLRLQADGQQLTLASVALDNARLSLRQGADGAQLQAEMPALRLGGIAARRGAERADLAELNLNSSRIDVSTGPAGMTELAFAGVQGSGRQLALARDADTLQLANLTLGSEVLRLALGGDATRFSGTGASATLTDVQAAQAGNRLALQEARWQARVFDGSSALAAGPARARVRVEGSELSLASLDLGPGAAQAGSTTDSATGTGGKPLATVASATWSAGNLSLDKAAGPLQLRGEAMALQMGRILLNDPGRGDNALVQLGDIDLSGAVFSLAEQSITADVLRVRGARASVWFDPQGRINLLKLLAAPDAASAAPASASARPAAARSGAVPTDATPAASGTVRPWRVAVKTVDLQDAAVRFEDRRRSPPLALGLDALTLNLSGVDTAPGAPPMQVVLAATLDSGGQVQAEGRAALDPQAVDLQLEVTGLALAPVQPVLSEYLKLTLASGTASTQGRLTYGKVADIPALLSYTGSFSVNQFLLEEIAPKRPFLAWESVKADDLKLTLEPNKVDIGEMLFDKPVGRLIIAEDQSINLTDLLTERGEPAAEPAAAAPAQDQPAADPFPVTVARIKVNDGQLEFADLSLRPQFGTRMHELKGVITGVGTDANRSAQVQLDARVDKFGSARIRGQVSLLQPERLTEIEMLFRNLDMTALSPYVVKFAGYEIASGRLSLDLEYKVRDGRLLGQNKVVLNKVELGKKVESPDALDLPLELALAVLKDANGVIDIGVPVSGDLNDPQFNYGALIGKAIGNLLGRIVTAPFRALAALFGGGGDKAIDTIDFEPGMATLAPPEQQKIETVARALRERPNLMLKVAPVVAPEQDAPVLQSRAVRTDIALRMGLELAPDEDPGPIDAANPRVPAAVEAAFGARYAPAVFDALKQRAVAAATPAPAAGAATSAPTTATSVAATGTVTPAAAVAPPPAFYEELIARMISEQPVTDEMLAQLASRRADAIVQAVTGEVGGVPGARVQTGALRKVTDATKSVVPLKLELDVAK